MIQLMRKMNKENYKYRKREATLLKIILRSVAFYYRTLLYLSHYDFICLIIR